MRRVGRPKGSRDKIARKKQSLSPRTVFSDHCWTAQSSAQGPGNQGIVDGKEICDLKAKYSADQSLDDQARYSRKRKRLEDYTARIDCLNFSAESDPFHSDWPHW